MQATLFGAIYLSAKCGFNTSKPVNQLGSKLKACTTLLATLTAYMDCNHCLRTVPCRTNPLRPPGKVRYADQLYRSAESEYMYLPELKPSANLKDQRHRRVSKRRRIAHDAYNLNCPFGKTVTHGPSACPQPAKSPVWTKLYGPVSEDDTACSTCFCPLDSAFVNRWYWLLR